MVTAGISSKKHRGMEISSGKGALHLSNAEGAGIAAVKTGAPALSAHHVRLQRFLEGLLARKNGDQIRLRMTVHMFVDYIVQAVLAFGAG